MNPRQEKDEWLMAQVAAGRRDHLEPLVRFYTSPGFCTELLHIFWATDLQPSVVPHDEEETLELLRLPLDTAIERALNGELTDAKTIAGLLAYRHRKQTH